MTKAERIQEGHDLIVTEGLHRRKRSLLAFSALLSILGVFAQPGQPIPLGLGPSAGNGSVSANVEGLAWMLFIAASYYMLGFSSEVLATRPLNSEMAKEMAQHGESEAAALRQLEEIRMDLVDYVQGTVKKVRTAGHLAEEYIRARPEDVPISAAVHAEIKQLVDMQEPFEADDSLIRKKLGDEALVSIITRNREAYERVRKSSEALSTRAAQFASQLDGVSAALSRLEEKATLAVRNTTDIRRAIAGARRLDFYVFEVAGAVGAYIISVAVSAHLLIAALPMPRAVPAPPSEYQAPADAPSRTEPPVARAVDRPPPTPPR